MLTLIINTKNEAKNISRLLKSIYQSTTPPKEIIIVDNFSVDKTTTTAKRLWKTCKEGHKFSPRTSARLEAWSPSQDKFKIPKSNHSEQENFVPKLPKLFIFKKGPERSAQKNFGAQKAAGSHLLFLDADMEVSANLIKELVSLAKKGIDTAIIPEQSIGRDFWGNAIALERNCYQNQKLIEAPRFIKRKLFQEVGGFDENLIAAEDWDLWIRIKKHNPKTSATKSKLFHHETQGFKASLRRKLYYTQNINLYARKHPQEFKKQSSLRSRFQPFWQNRIKLLKNPALTLAFIFMKLIIFIKWRTSQNE